MDVPKKVFREIDHSTLDSTELYVFDICNLRALTIKVKPNYIIGHSVLERIWIKGSYLSQWLPQGKRGPPKEAKSQWIGILHGGSH